MTCVTPHLSSPRIVVAALLIGFSGRALAGAWTQPEGEGLVIATTEYYAADAGFDAAGQPSEGRFRKIRAAAYLEYGLTDAVTLGALADYEIATLDTPTAPAAEQGVTRIGGFARVRLWRSEAGGVASIQLGYESPAGFSDDRLPALGRTIPRAEFRALYGRGFATPVGPGFLDLQAGYLLRGDGAPDQSAFDATIGLRPIPRLMLLAQSFNTVSLSRGSGSAEDYDLFKLSPSIGWDITPATTIQLGATFDVAGRNIETGRSVFLSLWRRF